MSMQGPTAPKGRHVGVINTRSERTGQAQPSQTGRKNALLACVEVKTYAMQYTDAQGMVKEPCTVIVVGDQVYMPPNSEQWTSQLGLLPNTHPIVKALHSKLAESKAAASAAPKDAEVDVVPEDG